MKLVIEDEAGTRSTVPFTGEPIVVGRAPEGVTFRLTDRNVSRRHARFVLQSGAAFVEDLGSLLGTRVNGERIAGKRRLRDGDLVQIGDYDLAVLADGDAVRPGAPPPLPAPPRSDPAAVATGLASTAEVPAPAAAAHPTAAPPPSPAHARPASAVRTARLAVVAGLVALALGIAAGFAAGILTSPPPPPSVSAP